MGKKCGGEGKKEEKTLVTIVLKVDQHCDGCVNRIIRCLCCIRGVQTVEHVDLNKFSITGVVDPLLIIEELQKRTKKKADLISCEQVPVKTVVLKVNGDCGGCIKQILRILNNTQGVSGFSIDHQKDLVTVKGSVNMDVKKLAENLRKEVKREVEIVPPKTEKESNKNAGSCCCRGGYCGCGGGYYGRGGANNLERCLMECMGQPRDAYAYACGCGYGYGPYGYSAQCPARYIFSDENPNACPCPCSVM